MPTFRTRLKATALPRSFLFQSRPICASSLFTQYQVIHSAQSLSTFSKTQLYSVGSRSNLKSSTLIRMSSTTMPAQHGHSEACCNIPPIIVEGYTPKGKYETIGGIKHYVTGPSSATTAILFVFDIFGYFPQTLQGADILSVSDKHHQYQVFIPDFFDGEPLNIAWYPPDNAEKQKKVGAFFGGIGAPPRAVGRIPGILKEIKEYNPNIKAFAALGLCWGGKVVALTSQADSPYKVAAQCHPAMVDPSEAPKITIPFCILASKDESPEAIKKFDAALAEPKHVETYDDQIHGWMGARSDLQVQRNKEEYERGYKTVLEFFAKHL